MFGQINPIQNTPDWASGTAAIIEASAKPAVEAYAINQATEINKERIKAGLPPLAPPVRVLPPQPAKLNLSLGHLLIVGIILLVFLNK